MVPLMWNTVYSQSLVALSATKQQYTYRPGEHLGKGIKYRAECQTLLGTERCHFPYQVPGKERTCGALSGLSSAESWQVLGFWMQMKPEPQTFTLNGIHSKTCLSHIAAKFEEKDALNASSPPHCLFAPQLSLPREPWMESQ